jgi:hypothetical protein
MEMQGKIRILEEYLGEVESYGDRFNGGIRYMIWGFSN